MLLCAVIQVVLAVRMRDGVKVPRRKAVGLHLLAMFPKNGRKLWNKRNVSNTALGLWDTPGAVSMGGRKTAKSRIRRAPLRSKGQVATICARPNLPDALVFLARQAHHGSQFRGASDMDHLSRNHQDFDALFKVAIPPAKATPWPSPSGGGCA